MSTSVDAPSIRRSRSRRVVKFSLIAALASLSARSIDAFTTTTSGNAAKVLTRGGQSVRCPLPATNSGNRVRDTAPATCHHVVHSRKISTDEEDAREERPNKKSMPLFYRLRPALRLPGRRALRRKLRPIALGLLTACSLTSQHSRLPFGPIPSIRPDPVFASAPLPWKPARKEDNPFESAEANAKKVQNKKFNEAFLAHQRELMAIQEKEGKEAADKFQAEWEAEQQKIGEEKAAGLKQLKYDLLDKGICPFLDPEGQRQQFLYEMEADLADTAGTIQYYDKMLELDDPKEFARKRTTPRFIVKCIVEDLKKKGEDPLKYFEENQDKTLMIYQMKPAEAVMVARRYKYNLEKYGSIVPPKEGEAVAIKEGESETLTAGDAVGDSADPEEEVKVLKAEAKAERVKAKEEARVAKAEAKAAKVKAKAEARAAKAKAKEELLAARSIDKQRRVEAKHAAQLAELESRAAADAEMAATAGMDMAATAGQEAVSPSTMTEVEEEEEMMKDKGRPFPATPGEPAKRTVAKKPKEGTRRVGDLIVPAAKVVLVAGGGGFAWKQLQQKAAKDEEERQRQFKLIMGVDNEEDDGDDDTNEGFSTKKSDDLIMDGLPSVTDGGPRVDSDPPAPASAPAPATPKRKKKRGLKSMFRKSGDDRETDLNVLLASDASAPEFSALLAKILTFGAPGRFPQVTGLPGGMPMDTFDLEGAKAMLIESRKSAALTDEVSAEAFASVVNCMIIDIIDLASSTLKEKDRKVTVEGLNIVMDFMDHAAQLFDACSEGVTITPVTYGGTLGKSKLEQMFSIYAGGIMEGTEGITQDRIDTLQQVFKITDKKAEGLLQKQMLKNLMEMAKDGKGLEGMTDMFGDMGAMGGLPGLGEGEEPSPEEVKESLQMMKQMIDSGAVSKEDMKVVRDQFQAAYGKSIEELIKDAEEEGGAMSADERELLDAMKSVLGED